MRTLIGLSVGRILSPRCAGGFATIFVKMPAAVVSLMNQSISWESNALLPTGLMITAMKSLKCQINLLPGTPFISKLQPTGKKIAIIGAGPAGLTAGLDLVRLGHKPIVFEQFSEPGGMMRVGIPPHRLPYDRLSWEIDLIRKEGVEIHLNHRISNAPDLLNKGFDSVLIAAGVHHAVKLPIESADHPGNWLSTIFLRRVLLGERVDLSGRHIIVLGAGDVALDVARTAIRLGQPKGPDRLPRNARF